MAYARSYDTNQALSVLAQLEGTVVVRQTPVRNPLGAGFGTVCIVGELTNDQYSDAQKSAVNTIREITDGGMIADTYGGFASWMGSSTDGFEGNLAAGLSLPGISFRRLLVITPNMSAGVVTFSRSAGGDAYTIPAGTRVSDGGATKVYATLEDCVFESSGGAQTEDVRVRPTTSSIVNASASDIDTIVDTLDDSVTSVTNASGLTVPVFDTVYATAIAATAGDTDLAAEIDIIICRRHTAAMRTALITNIDAAAAGRRARTAIYSPPINTADATVVGNSGVGVGTTGTRNKRLVYAYPNIKSIVTQSSASDIINMHADLFGAWACSQAHPVENIGSFRGAAFVLGLDSTLDVTPTQARYQSWRELGIASPQISNGKAEILSDRTTELTAPNDELAHVRTVDWLATSLHDVGAPWVKALRTAKNQNTFLAEVQSFLSTLKSDNNPDLQLIEDYGIDGQSGNTTVTKAAGLYVVKIAVTTLSHTNTILFSLLAGKTVEVKVLS